MNITLLSRFSATSSLLFNCVKCGAAQIYHVRKHTVDTIDGGHQDTHTSVTIAQRDKSGLLFIEAYSRRGFRLSSNVKIFGPMAIFPHTLLRWDVNNAKDITSKSLSLFCYVNPKPDILVIGSGDYIEEVDKNIIRLMKEKRISVEIHPTHLAVALFNELNNERRMVAGAMIPPDYIPERLYQTMEPPMRGIGPRKNDQMVLLQEARRVWIGNQLRKASEAEDKLPGPEFSQILKDTASDENQKVRSKFHSDMPFKDDDPFYERNYGEDDITERYFKK